MKNLKGVSLAAAAALAAILVPLYGDSGQGPVTHPEWAHMLLRALDMESVLVPGSPASLAFESLSWRTSVSLAPDRPFRSVGVEFVPGPPRFVRATAAGGELGYRLAIARTGDYRVRLKLGLVPGRDQLPGIGLELTRSGETNPTKSLTLAPAVLTDTGGIYLSPGVYTLSVALPPGMSLEAIEIVPPCLNSIEPKGGWHTAAITQTGDVAVTTLKALDLESELPPAATPIDVPGLAFRPMTSQSLRASSNAGREGFWLQGDAAGLEAIAHVDLPEPGLYTVYGFGSSGSGQAWIADGCLKTIVCPSKESPETPMWRPILTAEFSAGSHSFAVTLANGAAVQRLKIERKKDGIDDYLGTLTRLGLPLGEQRPIPRSLAIDSMHFIETKRHALELNRCGEILLSPANAMVAGLALPGGAVVSGSNAAVPGPGSAPLLPLPGPTALPGPVSSPGPTGSPSPAVSPAPSPSPASSPAPSPSPSLGPPPTTLVQQPASPVKE